MTAEIRNIGNDARHGNKNDAAQFFDVSLPTVEAWIRKGMPVVQPGGRGVSWIIDLRAAAEWKYGNASSSQDVDPDTLPPGERKAWYEGETKKRELQVRDRDLIPAIEVETAVATAFAALASGIWSIPDNLERKHGISGDVAELVGNALASEMEAAMERLQKLAPIDQGDAHG